MKTPSLALWAHRQGFLLSGPVQKYCFIFPEMGILALVAIAHRALAGALVQTPTLHQPVAFTVQSAGLLGTYDFSPVERVCVSTLQATE